MRKKYFLIFFIIFVSITKAQIITFPDANFKAKLLTATANSGVASNAEGNFMVIDTNGNNEIEVSEAALVYHLQVSNAAISSLSGIENFSNLRWLTCSGNNLTSLQPLSGMTNLKGINCQGNNLTSLSGIENLTALEDLYFSFNPITSVNLQNFHNLWRIWCWDTQLTELNICGTQVRTLWCENNLNLTTLYLKNGVVSSDLAKNSSQIPPPLHNFEFGNNPQLSYICYDEGEYDAVYYGINFDATGKTLTTDCNNTCALSVADNENKADFTVYPNPTNSILYLALSPQTTVKAGFVYNMMGQKVVTFDTVAIDLSFLPPGNYVIALETNQGKATKSFVKS